MSAPDAETMPNLVDESWVWSADLGDERALLGYARTWQTAEDQEYWDYRTTPARWYGRTRFAHICDRGERGVIRCAPLLDAAHEVTGTEQGPTVTPSILCPDCGTHGFVTEGRWVA